MKKQATSALGLVLGLSLGFTAILVPANAQQASSTQGSSNQSFSPSSSNTQGSNGSNPNGGVILCASKSCMVQQAAASNYPPTHHKPQPKRPRLVLNPQEGCSLEWRYIRLSNGMVRKIRECERPIRPIHYR